MEYTTKVTYINAETLPYWEMSDEHNEAVLMRWAYLSDEEEEELKLADLKRQARVEYNRKRGMMMSQGLKRNHIAYRKLQYHLESTDNKYTDEQSECLLGYRRALGVCCQTSMFREYGPDTHEFIAAHTCKHKYCNVCNARRAKEVRKRYRAAFEKYPELLENYDFMHLTLTVPHTEEGGWMGKAWYGTELMATYNKMRKMKWWKEMVFAGEFGVESTKNGNGMHTHIHSMLLVHKTMGNRNELHRNILMAWNGLTAWDGAKRSVFLPKDCESILKSNSSLTMDDVMCLDPKGATLIGLETVYLKSLERQRGYTWNEAAGAWIKRVKLHRDGKEAFMNAVMECIKYHFEPSGMMPDGAADIDLLVELLPQIKGKPLYRKFGAFHGSVAKGAHPAGEMLNLNSDLTENMLEEAAMSAHDNVVHPDTGHVVTPDEYRYVILPLRHVFWNPDRNYRPKLYGENRRRYLTPGTTMAEALGQMLLHSIDNAGAVKRKAIQGQFNNIL